MAINSFDVSCDDITLKSQGSSNYYKSSNLPVNRLVKTGFTAKDKHKKIKNTDYNSPYLCGDNVQLLSRITEKRFRNKKDTKIMSSFPLAAKLYKANSDEFKASKKNKKVQKSVLTLPNKPAPVPQLTTVSDINDSEYFNRDDVNRKMTKKRTPVQNRKCRGRDKGYEYYDRDALYCSQMNINLDCSSSDTIKNYDGDRKRTSNIIVAKDSHVEENVNPHDVWAVLRNINSFQFRPSPQISEDSYITPKKIKIPKRRNRKDMRVFETRTEEFTYISSIDVDNKSSTYSQSSSFDKITVIDNEAGFNTVGKRFKSEKCNKNSAANLLSPAAYHKNVRKNNKITMRYKNLRPLTSESYNLSEDYSLNNRENKQCLANNGTDYGFKNIEKDESLLSIPVHNTSQASQCSGNLFSSSKADLVNYVINKKSEDEDKLANVNVKESDHQINGITKVVLSKSQNPVKPDKLESSVRRQHQTTMMPNRTVIIPKLTQTAIKRRLNKQKYPIVILDKNQLSSSFEVVNQEHIQFDGLNEKVWPFMIKWYETEQNARAKKTERKCLNLNEQKKKNKLEEINNNLKQKVKPMPTILRDDRPLNTVKCNKAKFDYNKRIPVPLANILGQSQPEAKPKPMQQLKDRILKLLYKNSSHLSVVNDDGTNKTKDENYNNTIMIDTSTTTSGKSNAKNMNRTVTCPKPPFKSTALAAEKRTWAKAKWASDFIDNIIRKVKTGAYYTHESKMFHRKCDSREVEIQTVSICDTYADNWMHEVYIPGFDTELPAVEIKTMNTNEICVQHCMTNILVHFDVAIPSEPVISIKNSSSLIPTDFTESIVESYSKIYKSKTSILNAMLPAEICSIFPKMLRNILESGEQFSLATIPIDKSSSNLSTITEITCCEIPVDLNSSFIHSLMHVPMSQELWQLLKGRYVNIGNVHPNLHIILKTSLLLKYDKQLIEQLKPCLPRSHLFNYKVDPMIPIILNVKTIMKSPSITSEEINPCRALQPYYPPTSCPLVDTPRYFEFAKLFEIMTGFLTNRVLSCSNVTNLNICRNANTISVIMRRYLNGQDILSFSAGNIIMDCPLNGITNSLIPTKKINFFTNLEPPKCGQLIDFTISKNCSTNYLQKYVSVNNNKIRRKSFVKRYKKCKSASNIAGEKATPLHRITDLDDFFQALGSGKLLSSIFDSQSEKKIMSSIQEMKSWTTGINPQQALLVLLLANKKDTSNLLRYRSLILQGIAVNRITKVNELDMEIEVIERENLKTFPQYEGISYIPASIENQDNLFEELCWIAKNTASDYKRPFDVSSEKLLKSLLEKRKKLNPSYLRVMARYVGLGLLKPPVKK